MKIYCTSSMKWLHLEVFVGQNYQADWQKWVESWSKACREWLTWKGQVDTEIHSQKDHFLSTECKYHFKCKYTQCTLWDLLYGNLCGQISNVAEEKTSNPGMSKNFLKKKKRKQNKTKMKMRNKNCQRLCFHLSEEKNMKQAIQKNKHVSLFETMSRGYLKFTQ